MFISRPDAQLHTVAFGAASHTLLALGGWIGSWELWTECFTLLSPYWRTIAYDHRGSGAYFSVRREQRFLRAPGHNRLIGKYPEYLWFLEIYFGDDT